MFCVNCGQEVDRSDNYCSSCGTAILKMAPPETGKGGANSSEIGGSAEVLRQTDYKAVTYVVLYIGVALAIVGCLVIAGIPGVVGKEASDNSVMGLPFWIGIGIGLRGKQIGRSYCLWFFIGFLGSCAVGIVLVFLFSVILSALKA